MSSWRRSPGRGSHNRRRRPRKDPWIAAQVKNGLPNNLEFKNGVPQFAKDSGSGELWGRGYVQWRGRNETMKQMAGHLADKLGGPVTDATGLEREYDYDLSYTPEPSPAQGNRVVVSPSFHRQQAPIQLQAAMRRLRQWSTPCCAMPCGEQLGLEVRPVKNVPVDIVVLDSANKVPTEN